jgi:hypothetical protein
LLVRDQTLGLKQVKQAPLVRLRIITTTWKIRLLVAPFASNSDSLY